MVPGLLTEQVECILRFLNCRLAVRHLENVIVLVQEEVRALMRVMVLANLKVMMRSLASTS